MKVIDLLNKIANGEEVPKKIKHHWKYEWQYDETRNEYCYITQNGNRIDEDLLICTMLNEEIEILEEEKKIPKKLEILPDNEHYSNEVLYGKINAIIDYLINLKKD